MPFPGLTAAGGQPDVLRCFVQLSQALHNFLSACVPPHRQRRNSVCVERQRRRKQAMWGLVRHWLVAAACWSRWHWGARRPMNGLRNAVQAPPLRQRPDWGGLYIGGHFGAPGAFGLVSCGRPAPPAGIFAHGYNAFEALLGYFAGLQAGYLPCCPATSCWSRRRHLVSPHNRRQPDILAGPTGTASFAERARSSAAFAGALATRRQLADLCHRWLRLQL
jgi:hypothetical protein